MHADFLLFDRVAWAQRGGAAGRVKCAGSKNQEKKKTRLEKRSQSALIVAGETKGSKSCAAQGQAAIWTLQRRRP